MNTTPEFLPAKPPRMRRRIESSRTAPANTNRIAGVVVGQVEGTIVATIDGPLVAITDLVAALEVQIGPAAHSPIDVELGALPIVSFTFAVDVSAATTWTVPAATAWEFEGGQPLGAPLSGTIG